MSQGQKERWKRWEKKRLGLTVLVPLYCVSVVHWELVVEVVVSLADGNEGGDEVIFWSVLIVKRTVAEPVRERVDAEGRLEGTAQIVSGS